MHTPALIGILAFFAMASLCVAYFFMRVWSARREDREYLLFAGLCACLALHAGSAALIYARSLGMAGGPALSDLFMWAPLPSKVAVALAFHFTLLYTRIRRARAIALPIHVLMGAFCVLVVSGKWWAQVGGVVPVHAFGLSLHTFDVTPSTAALPYYVATPLLLVAIIGMLGRGYVKTRRGLGAWVGAMILGAAVVNDLGISAGWFRSFPLFAIGFLAFAYGVSLTLVSRYANAAIELQTKTVELERQSRELEKSYTELRHTQQELVRSEQLAVIGELAAVIAHEVRNPLAIVGNAVASLRKRHTTRNDRRTLLEIINEEMGRLDKLVGRLIHYARPVVLETKRIELDDAVERAAQVLDGTGVEVNLQRRTVPPVEGDPQLLRQAFENLLSNAAQASEAGSTIDVSLSRRNVSGVPVVAVSIRDHGEGMPQGQLESALTPFFTTRPTGTGLGLPIVARIVNAHGGQLQLDSELDEGTTVTVMLPLSRDRRLPVAADEDRESLLP